MWAAKHLYRGIKSWQSPSVVQDLAVIPGLPALLSSVFTWLKFLRWKGRPKQDSEDWNTCTCISMHFCISFFAHWQSSRSIWKSYYLAVIEDQWIKSRNNSAYLLVILLSCGRAIHIRWVFQDSSKKSTFWNSAWRYTKPLAVYSIFRLN